ncbi:MAG: hypothetical protein ACT4PT_00100 [Methanobacteriota archaeon]
MDGFRVDRAAPLGRHRYSDVFPGIERLAAIDAVFPGAEAKRAVLEGLAVEVSPEDLYMYIDPEDGTLVTGSGHLSKSPDWMLYLDLLHELVHVRQFRAGLDLYDRRFAYVDRPTEIEAYEVAVREGRRIGLDEETLSEYLRVEWVTAEDHARLAARFRLPP